MNDSNSVLEKVKVIFMNVLEIEEDSFNRQSGIDNIANWDSMRHLALIAACEKEFSILFDPMDVIFMIDANSICSKIEKKLHVRCE